MTIYRASAVTGRDSPHCHLPELPAKLPAPEPYGGFHPSEWTSAIEQIRYHRWPLLLLGQRQRVDSSSPFLARHWCVQAPRKGLAASSYLQTGSVAPELPSDAEKSPPSCVQSQRTSTSNAKHERHFVSDATHPAPGKMKPSPEQKIGNNEQCPYGYGGLRLQH